MADKVLLVKFGEIAMRGDNQYIFINRLILAIRRNLDPVGNYYVVREPGRLIVEDRGGEMDYDLVIPRVEPIFGLVALCPGIRLQEMSMDAIKEEALRHMQELCSLCNVFFSCDQQEILQDSEFHVQHPISRFAFDCVS